MPAKKKTLLFLGAGASKAFGYPITRNILPNIITRINNKTLFDQERNKDNSRQYRFILKELLIALSPGLKNLFMEDKVINENEELPLVTDLLSLVDYHLVNLKDLKDWNFESGNEVINQPDSIRSRWELSDLKILFEWAIISIIHSVEQKATTSMQPFIEWIINTNNIFNKNDVDVAGNFITIITSNYDYALEWNLLTKKEMWNVDKNVDYGFSWREPVVSDEVYQRPTRPKFKIFKLHGSSDWLKCDRCGHIYINPAQDLYTLAFVNYKTIDNSCHCGFWPLKPVLVTPSYVRSALDTNLHEIWKASQEELRKADEWIIIGYSMPSEDLNIKSLFLQSYHGRESRPLVKVIQKGSDTKPRFDNFFGVDAYEFIGDGFERYDFLNGRIIKSCQQE